MPKKLIQDIIVDKKIRTRSVRFSSMAKTKEERPIPEKKEQTKIPIRKLPPIIKNEIDTSNEEPEKISKNSQIFLWIISAVSLAALIFLASSFFSTASITVTPKNKTITIDDTYQATSKQNTSGLHFQVMSINKSESKTLDTDGEEDVERKAVGKAIIYNNYSQTVQRLINNTRLETTNGLIYKIRESVDVPGYKIVSGTKVPGSIEVEIIADVAGDKYNMKISDLKGDFKIPGFKGSPKYTAFYGRLSTDITGGFIGKVKKVSEERLMAGRNELKDSLKTGLLKDLYIQKPEQFLILKDNYFINYTEGNNSQESGAKYIITETGTINAIMFDKTELAKIFAKNKIKDFNDKDVSILSPENISSIIISNTASPWTEESLKFKFTGKIEIVWNYDSTAILDMIIGQNKNVINELVNNTFKDSIESIKASIRPQFKQTFPEKASKIKIFDSIRNITTSN
ncbi:MAG: hypothetical protein WC631_00735 [Candidatus Paceibacterota bacterium]|jgi:hypothetical protein